MNHILLLFGKRITNLLLPESTCKIKIRKKISELLILLLQADGLGVHST
jgi:hypothetical protein